MTVKYNLAAITYVTTINSIKTTTLNNVTISSVYFLDVIKIVIISKVLLSF